MHYLKKKILAQVVHYKLKMIQVILKWAGVWEAHSDARYLSVPTEIQLKK